MLPLGFELLMMDLLTFIKRWFCADKENGHPNFRFVSINDFKNAVSGRENKVRSYMVADMNMLIKHVKRE